MFGKVSLLQQEVKRDYCSQTKEGFSPPRNLEKGVEQARKILQKKILCSHDISDLNAIYREMDRFEKTVQMSEEYNSNILLKEVILKIEELVPKRMLSDESESIKNELTCSTSQSAQNFISLYFLKNFLLKDLPIGEYFEILDQRIKDNSEKEKILEEVANYLPFCHSEEQFNENIKDLIGQNQDEKIKEVLEKKRKKFQEYTCRKSLLEKLKQNHSDKYSKDLEELLEGQYLHLFDHLLEIQDCSGHIKRQEIINKIPFSTMSHIILETREAILRKVLNQIPPNTKQALLLLGGTGSGKSTTLCYLRGDPMIKKGFCYESKSNDQLIGHSEAESFTFLPIVAKCGDAVIIDFPGFIDTRGTLISLGMEFALLGVIEKLKPKVVIVETITNRENRFASAASLGDRLERLLGSSKKNCVLAVTKYSQDPDFNKIEMIEKDQRSALSNTSEEEAKLTAQIEALLPFVDQVPTLKQQIVEKRQQLEEIKQTKPLQLQQSLPDTEEKKNHREKLQARENELLKQIGLNKMIRLSNLMDEKYSLCFEELFSKENVCPNVGRELDAEHKSFFNKRFKEDLLPWLESKQDYNIYFKDLREFEANVLESSFIHTILSESNPEIGQLFHLPEIDPNLVREFDEKIVHTCIKQFIKAIVCELDIFSLEKALEIVKDKVLVENFKKKLYRLRDYILHLTGKWEEVEDPEKKQKNWEELRAQYSSVKKETTIPVWAKIMIGLAGGLVGLTISSIISWKRHTNKINNLNKDFIEKYEKELDKAFIAITSLQSIVQVLNKRELLDEQCGLPISVKSTDDLKKSIEEKITSITNLYGKTDWDIRVAHLADKFSLISPNFDESYFFAGKFFHNSLQVFVHNTKFSLNTEWALSGRCKSLSSRFDQIFSIFFGSKQLLLVQEKIPLQEAMEFAIEMVRQKKGTAMAEKDLLTELDVMIRAENLFSLNQTKKEKNEQIEKMLNETTSLQKSNWPWSPSHTSKIGLKILQFMEDVLLILKKENQNKEIGTKKLLKLLMAIEGFSPTTLHEIDVLSVFGVEDDLKMDLNRPLSRMLIGAAILEHSKPHSTT